MTSEREALERAFDAATRARIEAWEAFQRAEAAEMAAEQRLRDRH